MVLVNSPTKETGFFNANAYINNILPGLRGKFNSSSSLSIFMSANIIILLIFLLNFNNFHLLKAETWIKAAYYDATSSLPVSNINSGLFTHLYYGFAGINSSTYELTFPFSDDEQSLSTFPATVKRNNPSIVTLLSIGLAYGNYSTFSAMVSLPASRKSFIISSIKTVRQYGFDGLDLAWTWPKTSFDMKNIGILLEEWRSAVNSESENSSEPQLILTMVINHLPVIGEVTFPVESIQRHLDWVNMAAFDYHLPLKENVTGNHAALYDPSGNVNTDSGVKEWLGRGLPGTKLVLGLPYHGYAWKLVNPNHNSIGSPASGPDWGVEGSVGYKMIRSFISGYGYGAASTYNATYASNYVTIKEMWINFDDVDAIRTKVSYARTKGLLGCYTFQLANDDNWELSKAANEAANGEERKDFWIFVVVVPIAILILAILLTSVAYYLRSRILNSKDSGEVSGSEAAENIPVMSRYACRSSAYLQVFTFAEIKAATNNFSGRNKLGEGGYGPVYKGKLLGGQEVAVKRLSKTSHQGSKEFENEVKLTAELQHVHLVRVLGFCKERKEKMLIYEYMPNKSLDFYLFDQTRRLELNWEKRVHIIEGIAQGLLYLQEYSNLTIIHRDIKASNILLDSSMKPRISDFGMARIYHKENSEANTGQIVGTYGYVPPEYVRHGVYSTKYDVYSFGVLLLQIISGKRIASFYGPNEDNLLEYAYELWKTGNDKEFMDSTLDDSFSNCKLLTCLQVGLLCVQESPRDRPSMLEVYFMLRNENDGIGSACPKRPAYSVKVKCEDDEKTRSKSTHEIRSFNNVTISQMIPR